MTTARSVNQLISFYYKNQLYIRVIPSKRLFNSTMVHEVVNRGDVFAVHVETQQLTIIPGKADVTHTHMTHNTALTLQPNDLFGAIA
jgi:hypothetical protein